MRIQCPNCPAAYELDDSRVPPAGLSIKCPKCKTPFTVHRPKAGEAKGSVPLPGSGAAPSARPAGARAGASAKSPTTKGAVPLPGTDPFSATMASAPPPNPGRALVTPPPQAVVPPQGDWLAQPQMPAVPLPGLDDELAPPSPGFPSEQPPAAKQSLDDAFSADLPLPSEDTALAPKKAIQETDLAPKAQRSPLGAPAPLLDEGGMDFDFVSSPAAKAPPPIPRTDASPPASPELLDFVDEQPQKSAGRAGRAPPPVIAASAAKAPAGRARARPGRRAAAPGIVRARNLIALLVLVALGGVAALGVRARRTPAGLFWTNRFFAGRVRSSAATTGVVSKGEEKLAQGTFSSAREALGAAAQLLAAAPDDDEARSFFVLCASELRIAYGQGGADWDQARRVVDRIKLNARPQNRARGAFALASGDLSRARQTLAPLADATTTDLESSWLFAQVLSRSLDWSRAGQILDAAIKRSGASPKLLIARGLVARNTLALPDAAAYFEKAISVQADHGRALVELADVRLRQGDVQQAGQLLDKGLAAEARKTLDASEEARASMLRGKLFAAQHQGKEAEAAFEHAVQLDPSSAEVHAAYGAFRLQRREYEKAQKQLDSALQTDPGNALVTGDLARAYLGQSRLLEADKHIREAVAKDPSDAHLLYIQGKVAEGIGKQEEAYKAYEKALSKKPDLAEAMVAQGSIWVLRGDKQKARERLEAALKVPVRSSADEQAAGDLALDLGDGKTGKDCYTRALHLDPEDPQAHSGVGRALAALGDLPAARAELEAALRQVDTDPLLHYEYGSLLRRIGDREGAMSALQRAVQLNSKDYRFRSRLGAMLVERGEFAKAEEELRQAGLGNDRYGESQFYLARALNGQGKLADAIETMRKAVELEPDNAEYLYWLGLVFERGQQVQDAVDSYQKSIARNPKNADAYEHLGQNLNVENRYNEAVNAFRKAADLDPQRARLWAEVADSQQQAGDLDGAIASFQKSLAQDPNQPGIWSKLGIAYKDRACSGCKTRAIEALRRAEAVDPKDWVAHHELGYLYKDDGRRAEAIAQFRKYLVLRPNAGDVETIKDDIYYLQEESRRAP